SRALAQVGQPIDLGAELAELVPEGTEASAANRPAVDALTERIAAGLRTVSPGYESAHEARCLGRVGEIVARTDRRPGDTYVPLGEQERIARELARADGGERERVLDALGRYQLDLDLLHMRDHLLVPGYRGIGLARRTVVSTLMIAILAVPALLGALWNLIPAAIVRWAGNRTRTPVRKGTVRLSVALAVFPITWLVVALLDSFAGFWSGLLVFLLAPVL
ncbi:MAG: hypothetical protein KDB24_16130, partial [Microthrixaceae bacterium]|nr:hypothetical protein [Microthrixaceae bacterium]